MRVKETRLATRQLPAFFEMMGATDWQKRMLAERFRIGRGDWIQVPAIRKNGKTRMLTELAERAMERTQ